MKRAPFLRNLCIALISGHAIGAAGQDLPRTRYQRVIDRWYPGFRLLSARDFETGRDGLIVGHFDYDKFKDFAALIVGSEKHRFVSVTNSYDYYDGKMAVCFGTAKATIFRCEAEERPVITFPHDTSLKRIPPGRYQCYEEGGRTRTVITRIDSVGEASEKGGGFQVRDRKRAVSWCWTSD
jgi:hypothetical protein